MPAKTFDYPLDVVGLKFRGWKRLARHALESACPVNGITLEREQENPHDVNAIRVMMPVGWSPKQLGYIRADSAAILAPLMDSGLTDDGGLVFKSAKLVALAGEDLTEGRIHVVFDDKRKA